MALRAAAFVVASIIGSILVIVLQRPAFHLIHSVSPMSQEREARQGIGYTSLRRGALVFLT
jgi:hypothetical protein